MCKIFQGGQQLLDGGGGRRRLLVTTQVDDDPRDVTKERQWDVGVWIDERQQWLYNAKVNHIVTQLGPVTCKRKKLKFSAVGSWILHPH